MEEGYWEVEDIDYYKVPSHTHVERDDDTRDPICDQWAYIDKHACIGCYMCPCVADPTFFINKDYERACIFLIMRR